MQERKPAHKTCSAIPQDASNRARQQQASPATTPICTQHKKKAASSDAITTIAVSREVLVYVDVRVALDVLAGDELIDAAPDERGVRFKHWHQ